MAGIGHHQLIQNRKLQQEDNLLVSEFCAKPLNRIMVVSIVFRMMKYVYVVNNVYNYLRTSCCLIIICVKAQIRRSKEMCLQFGAILSFLVMNCGLYVVQVIMKYRGTL